MDLEKEDIQGLIVSSYSHLPCAAYVLLRIDSAIAAKAWISQNIPEITVAKGKQELFSTNFAFTFQGLKTLGLNHDALVSFSRPFQEGMATEHRSRILGDQDENAPSKWAWGAEEGKQVEALLLIYAKDEKVLSKQLQQRREEFKASGAFIEAKLLEAGRQPDSHEHFGFNDGVGQPVMEGTGNKERQLRRTGHATELPAGEFLLGHRNVYRVTADSPVVAPPKDPRNILAKVPDDTTGLNAKPGMHDLGRNGTYLVFRQLAQDVAKFWNFIDQHSLDKDNKSDPWAQDRLAAKLVGRWRSGAPLVLSPGCDDRSMAEENNFAYREMDAKGFKCPFGSHIRRANPRDSFGPDANAARDSANRHRIIRRGRSYGPRIENRFVDDCAERGLHFICLNSDIERQFEFVQQTWINNPVFGGLYGEVDPLIGNLSKTDGRFTVQGEPLRERVDGLSRFVTVRGGSYFFLPSIRALKYLASL